MQNPHFKIIQHHLSPFKQALNFPRKSKLLFFAGFESEK